MHLHNLYYICFLIKNFPLSHLAVLGNSPLGTCIQCHIKELCETFFVTENQCIAPRPSAAQLWNWFNLKQWFIPQPKFIFLFLRQ